ncbi:MAG TPA: dihydropteroate synthase [Syntrophorhabdaceae bacterium]|nr:dihydropteroate synthase [Syntrophorhabdaceae bacterium]
MILIGENLNVMSRLVGEAFKKREPQPVRAMVEAEVRAGVDLIELNIGPARKGGREFMEWLVNLVQDVTDLPLSLDTTNMEAMEAGLAVCRNKALINSISARPERITKLMPLAKKYGASFIGLTLGLEGIPRDVNERGLFAAEIIAAAAAIGIPEENIWLDPLILPVNTQQMQLQGCLEFIMMLKDLSPYCKSTCGISNVSNGVPKTLRGILNRTYLIMVKRYGMYSAIVDAFDKELYDIAKGKMPGLEALVHRAMDGEEPDVAALSKEEADYVKTTRVLLNRTLYSDSWLDL